MNNTELQVVVEALQSLVGAPFGGAWQPSRRQVVVAIGKDNLWTLIPKGDPPRFHPIQRRPKNPARPYSFQGALRAHISGPLTELRKHPTDRCIDLVFGQIRVHVRFTGRSGGLWLLDGDRVIAAYDGPAPSVLPPLPPNRGGVHESRFRRVGDESWADAARLFFEDLSRKRQRVQQRKTLQVRIDRELRRARRLLQNLEGDLDRAARAPIIRRKADALAAALHRFSAGDLNATVQDLEDPAIVHHIALDPTRPPGRSLDNMYRKARRLDRSGDKILERMIVVEGRVEKLAEAQLNLLDPNFDATIYEWLVPAEPKRVAHQRHAASFDVWAGPDGKRILVGRNAKGNRILTFQVAKGRDWWMHLREKPSAHLIIPTASGQSPPLELLLCAAQILAAHSKIQDGLSVDVQYTQVRHVRSIPGAADGRVRVSKEKVLRITRSSADISDWRRDRT
jgi:predicted ribosome quality control (RQC) complex YloA/Tae2 family protein